MIEILLLACRGSTKRRCAHDGQPEMGSSKEYHDRRGVSVPLWLVLCILGGGALVLFMPTGPATHSVVQAKEPSNLEALRAELDREIASLGKTESVVGASQAAAASTLLNALPKKKYKKTKQEKLEDEPWKSQLEPLWGLKHNPSADVVMALGFGARGGPARKVQAGRRRVPAR